MSIRELYDLLKDLKRFDPANTDAIEWVSEHIAKREML